MDEKEEEVEEEIERCEVGIESLDNLLRGGIPRGNVVLLAGSSGTGKTALGQEFLFRGAKMGEKGTYISLTEPISKIIRNLKRFSYYDKNLVGTDVKIIDLGVESKIVAGRNPTSQEILRVIRKEVEKMGAKRVVIDSITAICQYIEDHSEMRKFIFRLSDSLAVMDCTALLISEIPPQQLKYSMFGVEEFISDGIILLGEYEHQNSLERTLQVVKMRGIEHSRAKRSMLITKDGIVLMPMISE